VAIVDLSNPALDESTVLNYPVKSLSPRPRAVAFAEVAAATANFM